MKPLKEYLEGIDEGETVPSIKGVIQSVKVNEETGSQSITINDGTDSIKIVAKDKGGQLIDPVVGNVLSATVTSGKALSKGLVLKVNKTSKVAYIVASMGVHYTQSPGPNSVTEPEVEQAPKTGAELLIENYILDRLYVFKVVTQIVREFNAGHVGVEFPESKVPELATSAHIEIARAGVVPRPTDQQLERKKVHKEVAASKKEDKPAKKPVDKSSDDWRTFVHPTAGTPLGDYSPEEMATKFLPWMYRTNPATLKPAVAELHRVLREAMEGLKLTPQMVIERYLDHYASEFAPNSVKRKDAAIAKFCEGLVAIKVTKNNILDGSVTEKESEEVLKQFPHLWKQFVETKKTTPEQ